MESRTEKVTERVKQLKGPSDLVRYKKDMNKYVMKNYPEIIEYWGRLAPKRTEIVLNQQQIDNAEIENEETLMQFEGRYPNKLNDENVDSILKSIKQKAKKPKGPKL